jgi:hypothetical protein
MADFYVDRLRKEEASQVWGRPHAVRRPKAGKTDALHVNMYLLGLVALNF